YSSPASHHLSKAATAGPRKFYALQYTYVSGMLEKRVPYREAHLELLNDLSSKKRCLLGGAFTDGEGAVIFFASRPDAEGFVAKDPYSIAGLVTEFKIRDYMAVTGSLL
ncbi:unnamed protein product, partial [Phaeothamnion confervicola]